MESGFKRKIVLFGTLTLALLLISSWLNASSSCSAGPCSGCTYASSCSNSCSIPGCTCNCFVDGCVATCTCSVTVGGILYEFDAKVNCNGGGSGGHPPIVPQG